MKFEEIIDNLDCIQCIEIPQTVVNNHLCAHGHKVVIYDDRLVLNTKDGLEAHLGYYSHKISYQHIFVTLEVLKLKPLYYSMALPLIGIKHPYLKYTRETGSKFITCDITRIPGIYEMLYPHIHRLGRIDIKAIELEEGKIVIELCRV